MDLLVEEVWERRQEKEEEEEEEEEEEVWERSQRWGGREASQPTTPRP